MVVRVSLDNCSRSLFHCATDRYQSVTKWEKLSFFLAKRICSPSSRINTLHADNNFTFYLIRNCFVDKS